MDAAEFNAAAIDEFRASGGTVGGSLADTPLLLLGTTGATTGLPRTTPLAYRRDGDRLYVIASQAALRPTRPGTEPAPHPVVSVEIGTERFDANATVLEGRTATACSPPSSRTARRPAAIRRRPGARSRWSP